MLSRNVRLAVNCIMFGSLTAAGALAAENGRRVAIPPGGVQLWNCGYWETPRVGSFSGDNAAGVAPLALCGVRNGSFSGCIVATGAAAIGGLKAAPSDLALDGGGASIPASAVRVRYAALALSGNSWAGVGRFDALLDEPPAEVPVPDFAKSHSAYDARQWSARGGKPVATVPIWVTVKVPRDARPGRYAGTLTVAAQGLGPVQVPVSVEVIGWTLPDPREFTVRNLGRVSWESEAQYYRVPAWSERHLELSGRTLELMGAIGSQQLDIDLAEKVKHRDNSESMVLWVKQPDGSWKYDFSAVDRVFDLCAKKIGRPCPLRVNLWHYEFSTGKDWDRKGNRAGKVTTLDPATGQKGALDEPKLGTPENVAFWKSVLDELRRRIEKRGWWDVTAVGDVRYAGNCDAPCVDMVHAIWPDARWFTTQHGTARTFVGSDKKVTMPVAYGETVWGEKSFGPYGKWLAGGPAPKDVLGLRPATTGIECSYARNRHHDHNPIWVHRALPEEMVIRGHHGVGPLGGNLWPLKDARGRFWCVGGVGSGIHLGPCSSTRALVAPGPDGAVASERYEAFREGVQAAEALLMLSRVLGEGKPDAELAKKVRDLLAERLRKWTEAGGGSGTGGGPDKWDFARLAEGAADRDRRLFLLAGEVAARLGGR